MTEQDYTAAPLYAALRALAEQNGLRMHMPGHKGRGIEPLLTGAASIDYTELPATGNLFEGGGPIGAAERLWAQCAGAGDAMFLTGGSTLGILASLAAAASPGDAVLADRGCHRSVFHGMALLDLQPSYVVPALREPFGVSAGVTPAQVDAALSARPARAVLVTSPTYYGLCCDVAGLARVCHAHGAVLIVDQAHGAHFPFVGRRNACAEGADYAVASAHKTLPALGGGALLFTAGDTTAVRQWASVFGSTSPSYPIMASMDWARAWLEQTGAYARAAERAAALRARLRARTPFAVLEGPDCDPCRLTVCTAAGGIRGFDAADLLRAQLVEPEMADSRSVVCILTCMDTPEDLDRLARAFETLGGAPWALPPAPQPPQPRQRLRPREALFAPAEELPLERALGRVAARPVTPYPPGIPVIAPGEEISEKEIAYLRAAWYNNEERVFVVR